MDTKKIITLVVLFCAGIAAGYFFSTSNKGEVDSPVDVNQSGMVNVPDSYGQSDEIVTGFNQGAAEKLAPFLAEDIDMILFEEEDLLTAEEAKDRLATFFEEKPAGGFSILHRGQSEGGENSYLIGNYRTGTDAYRTYIAFKNEKIVEIRVEEKDK